MDKISSLKKEIIDTLDFNKATDIVSIDLEGNLNLPELGIIKVSGFSIDELESILMDKYKKFIFDPDISIQLIVYKPINVVVKGEVSRPGLYTFKARRINLYQNKHLFHNKLKIH